MYGVWFRLQIKRLWQKSCHSPFFPNKRCSPVNSSVTSQNIQQTWEAVFWNCSLWLGAERQAHDLFLKRCSKACICGNKPNQTKNRRSYFCLAVLITWCRTAFSQPLPYTVFSCQLLGHQSQYLINMRSYFLKSLLVTRSETAGLRPLGKRCSKASFSVLSQIYAKMWKAIFTKFFLILETKQLFHDLSTKRCSISWPSVLAQKMAKYEELFCHLSL